MIAKHNSMGDSCPAGEIFCWCNAGPFSSRGDLRRHKSRAGHLMSSDIWRTALSVLCCMLLVSWPEGLSELLHNLQFANLIRSSPTKPLVWKRRKNFSLYDKWQQLAVANKITQILRSMNETSIVSYYWYKQSLGCFYLEIYWKLIEAYWN